VSQGQRFRRRALRRGYKVDEVDSFLDRVEATLAGEAMGTAITAQEVHDVVFRVRFGGYDEWQVDLHLDRVERQLADLEERGAGGFARGLDARSGDLRPDVRPSDLRPSDLRPAEARIAPPDRIPPDRGGPPDRTGPPDRMGPSERVGPPDRGAAPTPPPMPTRPAPVPPPSGPPREGGPRPYDQPTYASFMDSSFEPPVPRRGRGDLTTEIRMTGKPLSPETGGYGPAGAYGAPTSTEAARVDQLRRTFQLRRFGSGYDRGQVDRLFEAVIASLSGRGSAPSDADLDPAKFDLVPGGYFEGEVDAALKEVRDLLSRHR
jgi:DivIVA domain-containing protein